VKIDFNKNQLILMFPYDPNTIGLIKEIPDRRWDPKNKVWRIPALLDNFDHLKNNYTKIIECSPQVLSWHNDQMAIMRQLNYAQKFKDKTEIPDDYTFKTKPFKHQLQCFHFFKQLTIGALFLEMGLGKTKCIIDLLNYFIFSGKRITPILYACPNSVLENVKHEFELHSPLRLRIEILSGTKQKKCRILKCTSDIFIINYEAIRTIEKELSSRHFYCVICDESTRIKNPQAQCSKALHRLSQLVPYRYILSGTPITQSAVDIFSQYKFLEPNIFGSSYYAFKNKYAVMGGYLNKQIVGYRKLDELQQKIYKTAIRFTKKECLDLPDKVYEVKQFSLNKEEQKVYNDVKKKILVEIEGKQLRTSLIITKLIKLSQITTGFVKLPDEVIRFDNPSKLMLLKELLGDILPNKLIIWCNFTQNIKDIPDLLAALRIPHVTLSGATPQSERQNKIDSFQQDPDCKVFLGQIRTGGMGINLTAASYVIYYGNTYSLADRLQSEDRCHRIGQTNKVTYIDLVARDTIENSFIKILAKKQDLATALIDHKVEDIANGTI